MGKFATLKYFAVKTLIVVVAVVAVGYYSLSVVVAQSDIAEIHGQVEQLKKYAGQELKDREAIVNAINAHADKLAQLQESKKDKRR